MLLLKTDCYHTVRNIALCYANHDDAIFIREIAGVVCVLLGKEGFLRVEDPS